MVGAFLMPIFKGTQWFFSLNFICQNLGYEKSERSDNDDYRNGYKRKRVNSSYGAMEIEVPQDRKSTFEPQVVKKRQKDISDIDQKIISMYAKGMTTRQISETIEDIYGFETSEGFISDVTDKILPQIEDWQVIYTTNAIESLNSTYRKLNRQRSVFPSDTALLKALYLATFEATKKWTSTIRNWGAVYGELSIMYEGRLPE